MLKKDDKGSLGGSPAQYNNKQKGSVLILMVLIIAIIASISLVTLNVAISQYQIKKSNSNIKRSFYLSEDGINSSAVKVYNLVCEAGVDSVNKAEEYMELYPDDVDGAESKFKSNYKLYVINKALGRINTNENPYIEIINYNNLIFVNEELTLRVKSKYVSNDGIEKSSIADIVILVPCYFDIKTGAFNFIELIDIRNFDI